jgi:type III secretion protein Q
VALDRLEPVLAAIEAATGLNLEPSDVSSQPPKTGLSIALEVTWNGETAPSRLVFHVAAALAGRLAAPAIDLSADGVHLGRADRRTAGAGRRHRRGRRVAALRPGDIVLTAWGPNRPGDARLILADRRLVGRFDPADRRFTVITLEESAMTAPPMDAAVQPADTAGPTISRPSRPRSRLTTCPSPCG